MKILVTAFISLVACAAFAHGEVEYNWPSANGIPVNNACATNDSFKSLKPVRTCTKTEEMLFAVSRHGEADMKRPISSRSELRSDEYLVVETKCDAWGMEDMVVSRTISETVCTKVIPPSEVSDGGCLAWATRSRKLGTTFMVEKITHYGEADDVQYVKYTVPMCASSTPAK